MSRFLMGAAGGSSKLPSFFKVLIDPNFTRQLRLPIVFVREHGETLAEKAVLRASSGESWVVKLEHIEDAAGIYFTRGWSKFAEDLGLQMGEFLVFWLAGNSTFDVSVYGISGCNRVIVSKSNNSDIDKRVKLEKLALVDHGRSPLYFELVLKKHHFSQVSLTMNFVRMSGLITQKSVLLEYVPNQHFASAVVRLRPKFRADLVWLGFVKENQMVFGRTYSFEFDPNKNVIKIDVIKK